MPASQLLTRADLQADPTRYINPNVPASHGTVTSVTTSGSTGRPITVWRTAHSLKYWAMCTLRDHEWHRRDFSGRFGTIRWFPDGAFAYPGGELPDWGPPVNQMHKTGPGFALAITATSAEQAEWLQRVNPHYLTLFPSLLADLVRLCPRAPGNLRHVRTLGESLEPDVRALVRQAWGVPIHDMYSAQEVGYIALQCPKHEHYHVMADCLKVEVVSDDDQPCAPGEVGRVVITTLHNAAMPLVRYAIGDYAEVGGACDCGIDLPVLARIFGRARNMLTLPNGDRVWPRLSELRYSEVLPVKQFQVVQTTRVTLEVRLVSSRVGTPEEEARLRELILGRIGARFELEFRYLEGIAREAGGKFEDFRSELGAV